MAEILYKRKNTHKASLPKDYRSIFRFKKENVKWLASHFAGQSTNKDLMSRVQKMKICLRYLADAGPDEILPNEHNCIDIDDASLSKTVVSVITKIAAKADNWIKFPQTAASVADAKEGWRTKYKFPTAIGVVGCTHIRIKKAQQYDKEYFNEGGACTLNVQATCDAKGMFTSVDTRWPGSVKDSKIWGNSIIKEIMANTPDTVLLADANYETEPWLMTPFRNPGGDNTKIAFNRLLTEEKKLIQQSFEDLKRRFPILECVSCSKHEMVSDIITACFVLQNIAKHLGEDEFQEDLNAGKVQAVSESNVKPTEYVKKSLKKILQTDCHIMSNTTTTAFGTGLQQHNLATPIKYINQNGVTSLSAYPSVATTESGLMLDKQSSPAFFTPTPNQPTFYSTQLVAQAPGTILITNNFGPDESTISGIHNNFNNSSIRIVTHNNNNNTNQTNNNSKESSIEEANHSINNDTLHQQQHYHHLHQLHHQPTTMAAQQHPSPTLPPNPIKMPNSLITSPAPVPTNTSTVVLDRINICINNHYGDTSTMSPLAQPQNRSLLSPIIPPVVMSHHTTIIDSMPPVMPTTTQNVTSATEMHVDEPDSTTSTHGNSDLMMTEQDTQPSEDIDKCPVFDVFTMQKFSVGEDALVKRRDGRYYLGTVVNIHRQQYLVQFDDKTDYWSNVDELMKLSSDVVKKEKPTCLACKRENDDDIVEICERCGRGYHRKCTKELSSKSGEWMCKRCLKPMKYSATDELDEKLKPKKLTTAITQFPYALDSLTWDEKHRVNLEQIYCYCGKSGQFDNNMIQCCKCKQWFHAHCVDCVKTLFRGDVFFIFGCSVCNDGQEFLRRIEMKWVDLAHLIIYNISIMKNFQKYHHLYKDIFPFALEKRSALQLPSSMLNLSDVEFKKQLLKTMQAHPKLFQCGKEIKKDHAFWGLRANKPPQSPTYNVEKNEVLSTQLIKEKLKINVLACEEEESDNDQKEKPLKRSSSQETQQPLAHSDETALLAIPTPHEDDDDKFTSDDEIPIKLVLEKAKISNSTLVLRENNKTTEPHDEMDSSDNAKELQTEEKDKKEKKQDSMIPAKNQPKSSRKRKAFTLSKEYKNSEKLKDLPRSICDSSSDENSSSSRGTLDLIIPPPKNFLGVNNPFRMVTPKKSDKIPSALSKTTGSLITRKTVSFGSNSIFSNTLDLNSKLAALKSSGLFPNISNSDIAKAAGQPRLVRTIKRRLSAKDIMIGPNQEVRRRRTRPLPSDVEVISTTTINPIPSNFFPIRATLPESTNVLNSIKPTPLNSQSTTSPITSSASSSLDCVPLVAVTTHGRRLRKRPEKTSPQNSRRNSISSSSSSNSSLGAVTQLALPPPSQPQNAVPMSDLKQSVNKYFGAANRIENGERFTIRAKRRLNNGQTQYLIEWES